MKEVEISPISMSVTYSLPRNKKTEIGYSEDVITAEDGSESYVSSPFLHEYYEEPPYVTGVRMKDGTVILGINVGPGSSGYTDETGDIWIHRFGTGKILAPEEISAVLFINRDTLTDDDDITEENCIEVPL